MENGAAITLTPLVDRTRDGVNNLRLADMTEKRFEKHVNLLSI